jgi:hypothetical protein
VIWVESQPGLGAKFYIMIPAEVLEPAPPQEMKKAESLVMGAQQLVGKTRSEGV